jgi:hypothetical protein
MTMIFKELAVGPVKDMIPRMVQLIFIDMEKMCVVNSKKVEVLTCDDLL